MLSGPAVFPIEFKRGERHFHLADFSQAWDYALELRCSQSSSQFHGAINVRLLEGPTIRSESYCTFPCDSTTRRAT